MPARKFALDRLMPPFIAGCIGSFRDAYAGTGMNLAQSIIVLAVAVGQRVWRIVANRNAL